MLNAVQYLGPVGIGATSPQLMRGDDGKVYIVKLQNNRLGAKVLVNELLAVKYGEALDLCFPPGGMIRLTAEFIKKNPILYYNKVKPGCHYACLYFKHTRYVDRLHLFKATNKEQMAGVMLFDHLFHNLDRTWNRRNLLIRKEEAGYVLYAIDNSHLFKRGVWTIKTLEKLAPEIEINSRRCYGLLLKHYFTREHLQGYVQKIKQLADNQLSSLVADIPTDWLPDEDERQALLQYLIIRRDMTDEIAAKLCECMKKR